MRLLTALHAGAHPDLTGFFSVHYLALFLPAALIAFTLTPKKWKKYMLLLVSLGFYWLISGVLLGYLLGSAVLCCLLGLGMDALHAKGAALAKLAQKPDRKAIKRTYHRYSRYLLTLGVLAHIGTLLVLKYAGFFLSNVNALFSSRFAIPEFVKPLGLSFFVLQSVSYLVDVYRQSIPAEKNPAKLTLFLAFFPQIVEGPICRYSQTAEALWQAKPITYANFTGGIQRIGYGLMKKLVVADRLNPLVEELFSHNGRYPGWMSLLGAALYTMQLYMDFSGSMDAVCGTAQLFGISMPENFRRPFFSRNISEFWSRWHITLGTWFKDYIFYPVTMSAPMKKLTTTARKRLGNHYGPLLAGSVALFCVWFSNGLWHGAAWHYIVFGLYHLAFILLGNLFSRELKAINQRLSIPQEAAWFRVFQMLRTTVIVIFGELIFRADHLPQAGSMLSRIFTAPFTSTGASLPQALAAAGCDWQDLAIVAVTGLIVLAISTLQERGIAIRDTLNQKTTPIRWALWYALILYILIFGAYGVGYTPIDPMYANF